MKMRGVIALGMAAALAVVAAACEESTSGSGGSLFGSSAALSVQDRRWDLMLTNLDSSAAKFTVTVIQTGGSGTAVVSVSDEAVRYANEVVWNNLPIPLGGCGFTLKFVDLSGPLALMKLEAGDAWVVMTAGGMVAGPAYPTSTSQKSVWVAAVAVPGQASTCSNTCSTGLFEGFPNSAALFTEMKKLNPAMSLPSIPLRLGPAVEVKVSSYSMEAEVPEIYLLSFSTLPSIPGVSPPSPVAAGNEIKIQYTRRIHSDFEDGDFFAVRLVNQRKYEFIEDLFGEKMEAGETQTITYTAAAEGDYLGLDFIVGLSGPADYVLLDDLSISSNGVAILTENFEGPDLTAGPYLWLDMVPAQALGNAGLSATAGEVLTGSQSYKFQGGRLFRLWGMSFAQGGTEAAEFTLTDGAVDSTYWLGSFMGASQGDVLVGTYNGKNFDKSCQEAGVFFINQDSTGVADASGSWNLTVEASLTNCDPGLGYAETVFPETRFNVNLVQIESTLGGLLLGETVVSDSKGNKIKFSGMVLGNLVMLQMFSPPPPPPMLFPVTMSYSGSFSGALIETETGQITASGTLIGLASPDPTFPPDTCELSGSFTAAITRP